MIIDATGLHFRDLNDKIRGGGESIRIEHCLGQRYILSGQKGKKVTIAGTPGNALGACLNGCDITVYGNAQDAVGDTMNDGRIVVHGDAGDALGYAMRGGRIFIRGSAGYRTGIHMKEYGDKKPAIVIGGGAGSFLGEYMAGGVILVLGLGLEGCPLGNFTATGMHGGRIYVKKGQAPPHLDGRLTVGDADEADLAVIRPLLDEYAAAFRVKAEPIRKAGFYAIKPDTDNPYKTLYAAN
ncbi:MAG: glutamate synthase [Clostridiales bacterium]|jgi:glutamate synthase domain-containing protein 3|nr:glutamate synthase [Clostridiales bacterium]